MSSESETGKIQKPSKPGSRARRRSADTRPAPAGDGPKLQGRQLVRFGLDAQEYGIDVHLVDEIRRAGGLAEPDNTTTGIRGTVTVHDQAVEIVDLRPRLGYPPRDTDARSRIILVRHHDRVRGMLVDTVSEVLRLTAGPEKARTSTAGPVEPGLIRERFTADEQSILVLDWLRILGL